jgi:hypothetical protein
VSRHVVVVAEEEEDVEMAEDYSRWIPKQDAADALGYDVRTLERKILKLKLRTAQLSVPGRRSITVVHPTDVERLKAMTIPVTAMPQEPHGLDEEQTEIAVRPALPAVLQEFAAAFLGTLPFPPRALFGATGGTLR